MSAPPPFARSDLVALVAIPGVGLGFARGAERWALPHPDPMTVLASLPHDSTPRWVWWGRETADLLAAAEVPIDRCWDVATVHRLLFGGWRTSTAELWAVLHGLDPATVPTMGQLDLLSMTADEGDPDEPVRPDGHLRPEWLDGGLAATPGRLAVWAGLVLVAHDRQLGLLDELPDPDRARATARAESAAELLCAELEHHGLPVDVAEAERLITEAAGTRPHDHAEEDRRRAERDARVLAHLRGSTGVNLRNPAEVKSMLRREGLDLPDTRAWRLERHRDDHPLIDALLRWRKAERIATTYGWSWLDDHVGGGRLRGTWSSTDGAAGRMTASAGLHNLPAEMRTIVAAPTGSALVRADLGQIEPRILAAVSGDTPLIEATRGDDLYAPIARRLGVTRDIAKVAVLGAMYGATTGESAGALAGLERNYPVAMGLLGEAAESGKRAEDILTWGGRRVRMWVDPSVEGNLDRAISVAAARGRYARNALIQGAAAEFFKVWAITVRRRLRPLGGRIVLCLHDELLVEVPADRSDAAATVVADGVQEAAAYWSPRPEVRFVADVSVVARWSEAK